MRRPPSHIPPATDRTPPKPRATPSAGGRVQRTVARSVQRRRDGCGRGHSTASPVGQPAEHRIRDKAATAQWQEVYYIFIYFLDYCLYYDIMLIDSPKNLCAIL